MKIRADVNLGANLKKIRLSCGLTQDGVCSQLQLIGLDYSRSFYSRFERGDRNIPVSVIVGLTKVFNCDYNTLFDGLDSQSDN